jgi:F0F1-type ATP synthase membrane subunit c/vacuolar-type H+-ATPase subunit K
MGTGTAVQAVPAPALGAASYAVVARVERLLEPPRRSSKVRGTLLLGAVLVALPLLSGLVVAFA